MRAPELSRRHWLQAAMAGLVPLQARAQTPAPGVRRHALLVGVSALQFQPPSVWLQGPAHDVQALRALLPGLGVAPARTRVLADGLGPQAAPPTRAALLQALDGLTAELAAGDEVLLYWSGHGVRSTPAAPSAPAGPDGLSTWLLARDAARAPAGSPWPLGGALASAEVGARLDAWLARGAQVCVAFDTCYAGGSTRAGGDPAQGLRWRGLRTEDLAVHAGAPRPATLPAAARLRETDCVALLACGSLQRTPEWRSPQGPVRGLFSAALCDALAQGRAGWDHAALARATQARHAQLAASLKLPRSAWPVPQFSGALGRPLWLAPAAG
jgi:hypothetical protein